MRSSRASLDLSTNFGFGTLGLCDKLRVNDQITRGRWTDHCHVDVHGYRRAITAPYSAPDAVELEPPDPFVKLSWRGTPRTLTSSLLSLFGMSGKRLNDHGAMRYLDPVQDSRSTADFVLIDARKLAPQLNPPIAVLMVRVATQLIPGSLTSATMTADQLSPCHLGGSTCRDDSPVSPRLLGLGLSAGRFIRLAFSFSWPPRLGPTYAAFYRSSSSAGRMMRTTASQSGFSSSRCQPDRAYSAVDFQA